eukprot:gb/GECH01009692.1/.p1 GENE.gb/GECH01009692.1/~~gb/GECH01009692.1/.p1  ORF type:complete len:632 (+),score=174.66 gb/GECH01009692.1/:1-1896(+)
MEELIPIVNKLQDVFHSVGMLDTIDLPQIAVVGSQSSGKSSVLENIVGRDFLPRGSGIVTRRPLVLQLLQTKEEGNAEWGEFLHIPDKRFYDFDDIRQEIVNETDRVTGKNKGISPLPIHLRIYSPSVLNLTVIDLPGVTKNPVGDQPADIEQQIRKMVMNYISRPNAIILAVSPANADIANSDSIQMAREVDPKGVRTIGVLTKLDLMEAGTDAMETLRGNVIPLKKGFIGVVNRGQRDVESKKSIKKAIEDEAKFFERHPAYQKIADKCGTEYLKKQLNTILLQHIRETLPEIKSKITELISRAQQVLDEYGPPLDSKVSQGALVLQLLTRFAHEYSEAIDGATANLSTNELFGGARINHIFIDKYNPSMERLDACEGLLEKDIKMAIRNAKGPRSSLFVPESAFEMLVRRQVKLLEDPSLRCVDQVFDELLRIVEHCEKHLARFPNLRDKVVQFVVELLREYLQPLRQFIIDQIETERAYVNTSHPDFFNGGQAIHLLSERFNQMSAQDGNQQQQQQQHKGGQKPSRSPVDRERVEMDIIRVLLVEYFGIIRKNITDSVPKSVMHFLVNKSKQNMQTELVSNLYKDDLFDELLEENQEIADKRRAANDMLKALRRAQDIINEVRDTRV